MTDILGRIFSRPPKDMLSRFLKGEPLPALSGERVVLRPFELADVDRRVAWPRYQSPFFGHINLDLETRAAKKRWYQLRLASRYPFWYAIDTHQTRVIGELALRELDRHKRSTRLGIHLSPAYVGQGLGTDALRTLLSFYFGELGFERMHLDVAKFNKRAVRCYGKCDFVKVGKLVRENTTGVRVLRDESMKKFWDCFLEKNGREYIIYLEMVADNPALQDRHD